MKHSLPRKGAALLLALILLLSVTVTAGAYAPGSYSGTAGGFGGDVTVHVTVEGDAITAVEIVGDGETAGIGTIAIEKMPEAIIAAGGPADTISGATITSQAINTALTDALSQAGGEAPAEAGAPAFTPGTYTGSAKGYNGVVSLDVTFSEDAITAIEVVESAETAHVGDSAYLVLFDDIMNFTSTGVDTVSGATVTSYAVLQAVEDAAAQAGCDIAALKAGAIPFAYTPGEKITDTFDVVIVGAGGAGMAAAAAAAQNGATVLVMEKMVEMGGNTLVAGGSFQAVQPSLVWDESDPEATTGINEFTGEPVDKNKMDAGRLVTLQTILNWSEAPFDETIADPSAIDTVDDYDLPSRGVHEDFLPTLQALKQQISAYMEYADAQMAAGAKETDLTLFSTVELHIFQTYYGGIRLNFDKTEWITNDFALVNQMCQEAFDVKKWMIDQGALVNTTVQRTLIGCLWQRINGMEGGVVDGVEYNRNWGGYFKVPENTLRTANEKNDIMYRTTATELISDGSRVTGVKGVQYDGTEVEITATKGVVIATGGYMANIPMVIDTNEYWDSADLLPSIESTSRSLAQGEGIVMAQAVGADVAGMGWTQLMPLGWVDNGDLAGGTGENVIYIGPKGSDSEGKRYVDESAERDVLSQGAFDHGVDNGIYVELGNAGENTSENNVEGRRYYVTLEEAEALLEIDAAILEQTISEYDAFIMGVTDVPPVPAKAAYRGTIGSCEQDESGNYLPDTYSIDLIQVRFMKPSTHHTMGGLVVDLDRHVLDADGAVIGGLFAAGEVTGNFFAGNRLGGNACTEILVSGRIAGTVAATE